MTEMQKIITVAVLFIIAVGSGIVLTKLGKPYQTGIFTVHKLVALGMVVLSIILIKKLLQSADAGTVLVLLIILAAVSILALFVTGAFMSLDKGLYGLLKTLHAIAPIASIASLGVVVYMLLK